MSDSDDVNGPIIKAKVIDGNAISLSPNWNVDTDLADIVDNCSKILKDCFGNPSSTHSYGRSAKSYIEILVNNSKINEAFKYSKKAFTVPIAIFLGNCWGESTICFSKSACFPAGEASRPTIFI